MQRQVQNIKQDFAKQAFNKPSHSNSLAFSSQANKLVSQGKGSFAQQLAKTAQETGFNRTENTQPQQNTNENFTSETKLTNNNTQATLMGAMSQGQEVQAKLKTLRDQEDLKEKTKFMQETESLKDSEELTSKFLANESSKAHAAQESQKQITEAYKEGSAAAAEASQDYSRERRKQLANWEELAPKIIEDTKNIAVRIDIPGTIDVETVIVRMQEGKVSVQAVGEKTVMEQLQANESLLAKKLREHEVSLDGLQAFDAAVVNGGAMKQAA